jgi:tripartite-type tricarboxylate transporter receptor subunit TctC
VRKALEDRSFVVDNLGPDAFIKMIADETAKWGPVIRNANIKGE